MATATQAAILREALNIMEDELRISNKQAKDFIESYVATIEEALSQGDSASVLGIVKLTPSFRPSLPKRMGRNPRTGEESMLAPRPASVRVRATPLKRVKESLPSPTSGAGKELRSLFEERQAAAAKRKAQREREEKKAATNGKAKKTTAKPAVKKKTTAKKR